MSSRAVFYVDASDMSSRPILPERHFFKSSLFMARWWRVLDAIDDIINECILMLFED